MPKEKLLAEAKKCFRPAALVSALLLMAVPASAQDVIHSFKGLDAGSGPVGRMVADGPRTLYGTTEQGGEDFAGTIFKLTRRANGKWTHKVLYSFKGAPDGSGPRGDLMIQNGVIYGTTVAGGKKSASISVGCGTVFSITKQGVYKTIHRFGCGADGQAPYSGLVFDGGSFYGTTNGGGAKGFGTVYRFQNGPAKRAFTKQILYSFKGGADGGRPTANVVISGGEVFGLTTREGIKTGQCSSDSRGCGTAFRLKSRPNPPWTHTVMYSFKGSNDGMEPSGPLTPKGGKFYGTTYRGGKANRGTVFELRYNNTKSAFLEQLLFQFPSTGKGDDPEGVIFLGNDLWGVTAGNIYSLNSPTFSYSEFFRFPANGSKGDSPQGRLLQGPDGVVYGVTFGGGKFGNGTVFEMFRPD